MPNNLGSLREAMDSQFEWMPRSPPSFAPVGMNRNLRRARRSCRCQHLSAAPYRGERHARGRLGLLLQILVKTQRLCANKGNLFLQHRRKAAVEPSARPVLLPCRRLQRDDQRELSRKSSNSSTLIQTWPSLLAQWRDIRRASSNREAWADRVAVRNSIHSRSRHAESSAAQHAMSTPSAAKLARATRATSRWCLALKNFNSHSVYVRPNAQRCQWRNCQSSQLYSILTSRTAWLAPTQWGS